MQSRLAGRVTHITIPRYSTSWESEAGVQLTVCKAGDIPEGKSTVVSTGRKDIAVFHVGGSYFAIDDCCPHAGASLAGGYVEGGIVTCPWHAWRFRLADGAWADNPRVKTGCYPVRVQDGVVRVEVPDPPPLDAPGAGT
jgi:nitrite reductase (NADH) small subunit/3-phenylpropionate/trans-cinnamate dioxygenase ferredoxin subunit